MAGYANYQCFQNSSGGAVVIDTQDGWQLLGIHLGPTSNDNSDSIQTLTHILLSPEQLQTAEILVEDLRYFAFVDAVQLRPLVGYQPSSARIFGLHDELYDDTGSETD